VGLRDNLGVPFAWALGIEDTFVPQVAARSGRILDEYVLTGHDRRWRNDLRLVADIGVRYLRYGIPWYRVNPAPGRFDWSWTDEVLPYLVEELRIVPILDLVHYGCPLWLAGTFLDPEYPARVAEYAGAVADRYRTLIRIWTPLNEPRVNAHFAGRTGAWPPYRRGERGFAQVMVAIARGMATTMDAIRAVEPEAVFVHIDAVSSIDTLDPALQPAVDLRLHHRFLAAELVEGRVGPGHDMWAWLLAHGCDRADLESLLERPRRMDIFGANFYPGMSAWRIEGTPDRPIQRRRRGSAADLAAVVTLTAERFGRPVMIGETSVRGPVWARRRWLEESVAAVAALRARGVPLVGYTWFPAFSLVTWSYRRGRQPIEAYLAHMGLWDLRRATGGRLEPRPTGLERRYAELAARESPVSRAGGCTRRS
jgi:beta-glucosidase